VDTNTVSPVETSTPADSSLSRRRMLTVALGGAAAAVVLPAPAWAVDDKRPGAVGKPALTTTDRMVANRVSAERALAHLKVLSEDIGPRIGGTASERAAAHYIARARNQNPASAIPRSSIGRAAGC